MCPAGEIAIRILHAKEKEKKKNIGCAAFVFTYDSRVSVPFLLYPKLHSSLTWVKGGNQGTQHSLAPGGGGGGQGLLCLWPFQFGIRGEATKDCAAACLWWRSAGRGEWMDPSPSGSLPAAVGCAP